MAGKKKSKKVQSNPARGFATTSSVSKSRAEAEEQASTEQALLESQDPQVECKDGSKEDAEVSQEAELSELTPDQLEARLEESELQLQVEKYQEKSKRDASRFSSRLKTEKRLLRGPAERLLITTWIGENLIDAAIENIKATRNIVTTDKHPPSATALPLMEEDLVVRLWTLERALLNLDFTEASIKAALDYVMQKAPADLMAKPAMSKDELWGADESFEYMAVHSITNDLPGYDGSRAEPNSSYDYAESTRYSDESGDTTSTKKLTTDETHQSKPGASKQLDVSEVHPTILDEEARDSDSDIDPKDQLKKYLEFKTRLFHRRPDLLRGKPSKSKKSKTRSESPRAPPDKPSSKLLQRIRKLERDLLFDKEEAEEAWSRLQITLESEAAAIRKTDKYSSAVTSEQGQAEHHSVEVSNGQENGAQKDIGELLLGMPDEPNEQDSLTTKTPVVPDTDGDTTIIRTFGPWTGLSPRRVLEEACKARDPKSKITLNQLSSTTFSSRQGLKILWTLQQKHPVRLKLPDITQHWNRKTFAVDMVNIACPDKKQSEAFVSTVALFLLFSNSPKEEKVYVRLPSIWRELWFELVERKQQEEYADDCERFRSIRDRVRSQRTTEGLSLDTTSPTHIESTDNLTLRTASLKRTLVSTSTDLGSLSQVWLSKASSPGFEQMLTHRKSLPVWAFKEAILEGISQNQAIILCGETGCGKSTQVPAFILENELSAGRECKIYCTQPRRISAISLARRVSQELGEGRNALGTTRSLIGYAIRLESKISSSTKLVYATTGVLMRMLENQGDFDAITHIVVDEVHERTIDSDFLLIILRRLMLKRPELKMILMSATVNADHFSSYLGGAPIITVPGRIYPVDTMFLEDAVEITGYGSGLDKTPKHTMQDDDLADDELQRTTVAGELKDYSGRTRQVLSEIDEYRINYELIVRLLESIAIDERFEEYSRAILVFLPGIAEIRRMNGLLSASDTFSEGWFIHLLHSTVSTEDQERAFLLPPPGVRKIVLATNIAETGITIPDITCVVDAGKHREMRFDERRQLSRLLEAFISRANAKQRRGRAGRVQKGLCFHLFTRARHDRLMSDSQTPEMLRLSLQDLALRVKICGLGDIEAVLAEAIDPPLPRNVRRAVDSLVGAKALTASEDLTALGRQVAKLPLDVYLGKLILLSCIFRCVDAGLSIAAILSSKSPFLTPINAHSQAREARLGFKRGDSDLLTVYNAYCSWRRVCRVNAPSELHYCRQNFLSSQTLSNIEELKNQLAVALVDAGFLKLNAQEADSLHRARYSSRTQRFLNFPEELDCNSEKDAIVDSVIAWSFYPKLLIREGQGYRNLANNQIVSLHPSSVNKGSTMPPKFLSFYHIMQSSSRFYHAHETSAVDDLAIPLLCGEADFKLYAGVLSIDSNRLRFSIPDWRHMMILKSLRDQLRGIVDQGIHTPGAKLSREQQYWFDLWQSIFSKESSRSQ